MAFSNPHIEATLGLALLVSSSAIRFHPRQD
jgi:hypothetical protein